jgi:hypothetical protein
LLPAVNHFTTAHDEKFSEGEATALFRERSLIDQFRPRLRERTFAEIGKPLVEFTCENQAQHGVPEDLETLIVLHDTLLFMCDRRVG